jgi:hypothetical protein
MSSSWLSGSSTVKQYRRYRKAGRDLNHKIIETFVDDKILEKAARTLGLGKNRRLVLDSKDDLSVLMDFALYEVRQHGKNLVERYQEEKGGSNRIERDLLASMVKAGTGLFKVEGISSQGYSLELRGLVEERKVILTDINFSQTMIQGLVVFFRLIELAEFTMTSGIAFIFPEKLERGLVARWTRWDQAERYARFFKLSKSKGLSTLYV